MISIAFNLEDPLMHALLPCEVPFESTLFYLKFTQHTAAYSFSLLEVVSFLQCWPKETLLVLFYEVKVPTSDGYSTM